MKREKGFTLIELLAVIVILAVISLIAMPMIMDIINKSRENAVKASAQNYVHAVEVEAFNLQTDNLIDLSNGIFSTTKLDRYVTYSGPEVKGNVTIKDGMVTGYDLYINGYRVKKDGDEVTTELSDGQVHNEVNEIDVVRGEETVHITNSSELQDGDVYVNGQYEYHYNAVYDDMNWSWQNDSSLDGWSMKLSDDALYDEFIDTPMVTKIVGKDIISMVCLFFESKAKNIDLSSYNTSNVTKMDYMFGDCRSLINLDVSNFDTSNVTSMNGMFYGCSSLTRLDLSVFNTSKVTTMRSMFFGCSSLNNLDVSGFDTSNVMTMNGMFSECSSLTSLDLSEFDTSNVTDMNSMFTRCSSLTSLDLSGFVTSKVTDMIGMFNGCSSLTRLDLSNFNTSKVTNMQYMFYGCSSLTNLDLSSFNTSNITTMNSMFYGCSSLTSLDVSGFNTSNVTDMYGMFWDCSNLSVIYVVDDWNTSKVGSSYRMFYGCSKLPNFNSSVVDKTNAHTRTGGYLTLKSA